MNSHKIVVNKANVHNLKDVTISIPKNNLVVITGPSGSGKSSLAFDTIYVEGQRRYIESLSSYARQFLGQFQPPDVESITGLSPAIAIDQKTSSKNPRSTVGTITEIYDYLRVLYARVGTLKCPDSGHIVKKSTPAQIVKELLSFPEKTKLHILAPIQVKSSKELKAQLSKFLSSGFSRVFIDGEVITCDEAAANLYHSHIDFAVVIDRVLTKKNSEKRLIDSVEHALKIGEGIIKVLVNNSKKPQTFSEKNISPETGEVFPDLEPKLFSFNSPIGACQNCKGLGVIRSFSEDLMLTDSKLSINDGALTPLSKKGSFLYKMIANIAKAEKVDLDTPFSKLPKKFTKVLFEGSGSKTYKFSFNTENSQFEFKKNFPGISQWLEKKYHETSSEKVRKELDEYMSTQTCKSCLGKRLNRIALSTYIFDCDITELSNMSIRDLGTFFSKNSFSGERAKIAEKLMNEITGRLKFLKDVGLGYLSLNRSAMSLSGGESQRIRLATQIGSALSGVLYVLDEPSIGLHQKDNLKLIATLKSLRDIGNTVIVVEHDEDTMKEADYIIDMGPGAGVHGGKVVSAGEYQKVLKSKNSLTAQYLSHRKKIEIPPERRQLDRFIDLIGATQNNIEGLDISFPLGGLVCVTGVSGSGKSTLIHEILVPALKSRIAKANRSLYLRKNFKGIKGEDHIDSLIELDQSPIGRTPHSNPATYTGLFDDIRKLFAKTQESQIRGYKAGRFSFNVKGGRCEECEGNGVKKIEMHFLPDIHIECSECRGKRYNRETLSVLYRGKNIADVLDMTIEEGVDFFINHQKIHRALKTMNDVGLGYMKLGQPATTLSGGEAQRLKLSRELAKKTKGHTFYVLDEPTTGLHFDDIHILLNSIQSLISKGNSVLIIEHNLDVIKTADWLIDLGPDGGDEGGQLVAEGSPEAVAKVKKSFTGKFLKKILS